MHLHKKYPEIDPNPNLHPSCAVDAPRPDTWQSPWKEKWTSLPLFAAACLKLTMDLQRLAACSSFFLTSTLMLHVLLKRPQVERSIERNPINLKSNAQKDSPLQSGMHHTFPFEKKVQHGLFWLKLKMILTYLFLGLGGILWTLKQTHN